MTSATTRPTPASVRPTARMMFRCVFGLHQGGIFYQRGRARQRPYVAFENLFGQRAHQLLSNCRAITIRWISLVPSPMVHSFTSR